MSYTRHYHAVIHGSQSKTISVNGESHTVTVNYSEPVDIAIHVDTSRFDGRVHDCRSAVNRLTGAVVAAEAAEVAAKRQTSRQIGNSILYGFFSYIRTDLSQQIRELVAKTEALLMELVEQGKDCLRRKTQMGDDYTRIANRYSSLFVDLDKEMANRIRNIAQPIFTFAEQGAESLRRPMDSNLLGTASIAAAETFRLDSVLKCSSIKHRAQKLIGEANRYLEGTYKLGNSVCDMLRTNYEPGLRYLPVAYVESSVSAQGIDRCLFGADEGLLANSAGLDVTLKKHFQDEALQWEPMDEATAGRIRAYFDEEVGKSAVPLRVAAMINALWANNSIKTIKRNEL